MDSDNETEDFPSYRGIPGTIILINVFDPCRETATKAHAATCSMIRQYLRQSTSQCVGVCLFGTEDTDDASKLGARNVIDVFPLSLPTLDDYIKLQDIEIQSLKQAKELVMSDLLLHCSKMFANCKKLLSTRTIIILSRLDTPPVQTDQKPSLKRVEDFVDSNVELRIINIARNEYKVDQFYEDFLLEANKGREITLPKPLWCEKEIEKLMHQQSHRHLAVAKLSFEIGNGMNIGVGVYSLIKGQGQARQKTSALDRETNAVLTSITKTIKVAIDDDKMDVDETEQTSKQVALLKSELLHYQEYGGERVEFTDDEMKVLKNPFGPPMLKLLGFKPASLMSKEKWYLKKNYFLFPNEGIIEGSTVAFKALHQACIETGMVAICVLCTRVNSRPINVALSPCKNPLGLEIDIGFDVICIPFVENVRDVPNCDEDEEMDTTNAHKNVLKGIITKLQFDYKPENFENPMLQSKYRVVEAVAFNEEDLQPFKDTTKPKSEMFADIEDELFYELFGPFNVSTGKRPTSSNGGNAVKKVKYEEIDESLLKDRIASGKMSQYTVADLKNILKSKDIPDLPALTGLKKAELIDLVCKNFQ